MTATDAESCAVVATAADIICSLRGADLAGWTPPWRKDAGAPALPSACDGGGQEAEAEEGGGARGLAWPAVARGKRSRSRRAGSPSASGSAYSAGPAAGKKEKKQGRRGARGSPASPLDYSGGSGSGASTSGGEDGAFCSQPAPATAYHHAAPATAAAAAPSKVSGLAGRQSILPVPPPRPSGQRPRKKMRLPEIQQLVRSLSVENDALRLVKYPIQIRQHLLSLKLNKPVWFCAGFADMSVREQEMKALQRACTGLSKENGKLETRLDHSSKRNSIISVENKGKPQPDHGRAAEQDAGNGFALPDLNLPAYA